MMRGFFSAWLSIRISNVWSCTACDISIIFELNMKNCYNNYDTKLKSLSDVEYLIVM